MAYHYKKRGSIDEYWVLYNTDSTTGGAMTLGDPLQVRLKPAKQLFYQEEAARMGKPLASYLRERLDAADEAMGAISSLQREVMSLRLLMEDRALEKNQVASNEPPSLCEILLLLRQMCRPEQVKIAQGELNRLGYPIRQF